MWLPTYYCGSGPTTSWSNIEKFQVRVWDLRGEGSESWTLEPPDEDQVAIASLSFHPHDHVLAIAGGNEIYFWDWSLSQPFASVKTNTKEERVLSFLLMVCRQSYFYNINCCERSISDQFISIFI